MTEEPATYTAPEILQQEQIDALRSQFQRLQDANLAPILESSAVLVELTRIADAVENQSVTAATLAEWTVSTFDRPPCDCDELWRLARLFTASYNGTNGVCIRESANLRAYVREHS